MGSGGRGGSPNYAQWRPFAGEECPEAMPLRLSTAAAGKRSRESQGPQGRQRPHQGRQKLSLSITNTVKSLQLSRGGMLCLKNRAPCPWKSARVWMGAEGPQNNEGLDCLPGSHWPPGGARMQRPDCSSGSPSAETSSLASAGQLSTDCGLSVIIKK